MAERVIIDTSVLVALIDARDKFRQAAMALLIAVENSGSPVFYLDCVVIETVGVLCRRSEEQGRSPQLPALIVDLAHRVPRQRMSWTGRKLRRLYPLVIDLVRQSNGQLNFNDALIALFCRELNITTIASFDRDFDQVAWLRRISKPEDLAITDTSEETSP